MLASVVDMEDSGSGAKVVHIMDSSVVDAVHQVTILFDDALLCLPFICNALVSCCEVMSICDFDNQKASDSFIACNVSA